MCSKASDLIFLGLHLLNCIQLIRVLWKLLYPIPAKLSANHLSFSCLKLSRRLFPLKIHSPRHGLQDAAWDVALAGFSTFHCAVSLADSRFFSPDRGSGSSPRQGTASKLPSLSCSPGSCSSFKFQLKYYHFLDQWFAGLTDSITTFSNPDTHVCPRWRDNPFALPLADMLVKSLLLTLRWKRGRKSMFWRYLFDFRYYI